MKDYEVIIGADLGEGYLEWTTIIEADSKKSAQEIAEQVLDRRPDRSAYQVVSVEVFTD